MGSGASAAAAAPLRSGSGGVRRTELGELEGVALGDVLVEDEATNQLAAEQGIDHLPAIRVYSRGAGAEAKACEVSCAPRGTGLTRNFADLREAVQACVQACTACGRTDESPAEEVQVYATPTADLVYAALPVSLVYVLVDKLGGIEADLLGI